MFDWWQFLELAQRLAADGDEAARRSAVSRAYYAAFGAARAWREGIRYFDAPTDGTVHQALWASFGEGPTDDEREVGMLGDRLRRSRNTADYRGRVEDLGDLTREALENARDVRGLLEGLRAP